MRIIIFFALYQTQFLLHGQMTICGNKSYPPLTFSATVKERLELDLAAAKTSYEKDVKNADAIIWYGRRLAYLGRYDEAIEIFTKGILLHPYDARMFRHRGHRYLTIRCVDKAISDFIKASYLIKNQKDEVEPDGMPNAKNTPTRTLQSNIWYHLGLAYYLKKDFKKAEKAYKECLKVSKNPDMYVATANWYYITLKELKKEKTASNLLSTVHKNMELIENEGYLQILLLYKGNQNVAPLLENLTQDNSALTNATTGFGVGTYYRLTGNMKKAREIFQIVTSGSQWASFAYMAAEIWAD